MFKELNFLEPATREVIARVCAGHGYDTDDVYFEKSTGKTSLVNEKFIKILLRLSDLMDISRYRISKVILNHNMENLNKHSRFHWISHLITDDYKLDTNYSFMGDKSTDSFLYSKNIVEKMGITIGVLMSQTTEVENKNKCRFILNSEFGEDEDKTLLKIACGRENVCNNKQCNFLCKWFTEKNYYLFDELSALKNYLNNISDNFFAFDADVNVKVIANTDIPNDVFDYLRDYVNDK